jgi:hypothetical protein
MSAGPPRAGTTRSPVGHAPAGAVLSLTAWCLASAACWLVVFSAPASPLVLVPAFVLANVTFLAALLYALFAVPGSG